MTAAVTKSRRRLVPTERVVQRQIVAELRARGLGVVHVPNGGEYKGTPEQRIRRAMAKRMDGEVHGFPDLMVLTKRAAPGRVAFLEVKRPRASLTTDHARRQLECHAALTAQHHPVAIVDSPEAALAQVREWGML